MRNVIVTTATGGIYTVLDATAFGPDALLGHTASDPQLRVFRLLDTDTVVAA